MKAKKRVEAARREGTISLKERDMTQTERADQALAVSDRLLRLLAVEDVSTEVALTAAVMLAASIISVSWAEEDQSITADEAGVLIRRLVTGQGIPTDGGLH